MAEKKQGKKQAVLLAAPSMQRLLHAVHQVPAFVDRFGDAKEGAVHWGSFPDGFPNLFVEDVRGLRNKRVVFFADFFDPAAIFPQISLLYALPRMVIKSLTVVLCYFPTGTMERVDLEGQVATAKTLTRMLSAVPPTQAGPVKIMIYDIHALQERFYFADSILPLLLTAVPLFLEELQSRYAEEMAAGKVAVAFPDDGASKRFGKMFTSLGLPIITCSKIRVADKRIVTIKEGIAEDMHVFIVDDLVQTGGTLLMCKTALLAAGASTVSAYVTHAIFPNSSWKRFSEEPEATRFASFYLTDSCPQRTDLLADVPPFRILSLASNVADAIVEYI